MEEFYYSLVFDLKSNKATGNLAVNQDLQNYKVAITELCFPCMWYNIPASKVGYKPNGVTDWREFVLTERFVSHPADLVEAILQLLGKPNDIKFTFDVLQQRCSVECIGT